MNKMTSLHMSFPNYACNQRTDLKQLIQAGLRACMDSPRHAWMSMSTVNNDPTEPCMTITVTYDEQLAVWHFFASRGPWQRTYSYSICSMLTSQLLQFARSNFVRVTVQTEHDTYHYTSKDLNIFS